MILSEAERIQAELDDRIEEHGASLFVIAYAFAALGGAVLGSCLTIGILAGLGMIAL